MRSASEVLRVDHLGIRRGKVWILKDVSWQVKAGEHWVILGSNGSGKTSLLSALTGYCTPTEGSMTLLRQRYGKCDWRALRGKVGCVSSSIRQIMPDHEPAWITVASGRYGVIDYWGTPHKRDRRRALRLLRQMNALEIADRPWLYLSQGERQRVLIGRALMAKPRLLILDEPCAGLDPVAREQFLNFIETQGRRPRGPSLVFVSHHVEEIVPVFSRALVLRNGRVLAQGPTRTTLTNEILSQTFGAPCRLQKVKKRYRLVITTPKKARHFQP